MCSVWSTAELFLDQCVKGVPAARRVNFRLRRLGGLFLANKFVARFVLGCPLGQTPATHHHVSIRLASGRLLSRCFLDSCTSPQKLLPEAQVEVGRLPEPLSQGRQGQL